MGGGSAARQPVGDAGGAAAPCAGCGKPAALCVCAALTRIDNRIGVIILRHPREARQALGSAGLAHRQLANSTLVTGLSWPGLKAVLGRAADPKRWGALYLGPAKTALRAPVTALDKAGEPLADQSRVLAQLEGIVVLDGNWAQAKTLWWRNPWLLKLRRLAIRPDFRSLYGELRREPRRQAVSTIEAIAFCLGELEGDPTLMTRLIRPLRLLLDKYRAVQMSEKQAASRDTAA